MRKPFWELLDEMVPPTCIMMCAYLVAGLGVELLYNLKLSGIPFVIIGFTTGRFYAPEFLRRVWP